MDKNIRIAVDAMGGDNAPAAIVEGVVKAVELDPNISYVLVGRESDIRAHLPQGQKNVEVRDAQEVIETGEDPMIAIRKKRGSSMIVALGMLKTKEVDAVVSAGSTGAFLAGALFYAGRIKGVQRPALAPIFPTKDDRGVLLIDCGANAECTPEFLLQFARMGALYMRQVRGVKNPRIGLVNNGAEAEKGTPLYKETHKLLAASDLNFVGNIEPRYLTDGLADVMVCDGFSGNMVLKSYEGAIKLMLSLLKGEMKRNILTKLAAAILMPGLKRIAGKLDYNRVGGAPLIGIDGVAVKAHGSSDAESFSNALMQAAGIARSGAIEAIKQDMEADYLQKNKAE